MTRRFRLVAESVLVVVIFVWASIWGTMYWNRSLALGRHPFFYQLYYEPAVMVACGKGFLVAQPQVPAMTRFLTEQATEFDCRNIPADVKLGTEGLYQGPARYLMTMVGLAWRIVGVSWQRLGPVAGVLFGVTIAAAYGIFRLGMGWLLAALFAWALSMSTLHLANLPHIRDYSKAPFALLLFLGLGLIVTRKLSMKSLLAVAAAYGAVLGLGYGFRTDLLVGIPIFVVTAFLFLDVRRLTERLAIGTVASLVCLASFLVVGWPIISAVNRTWGCQWHTAILGLGEDNAHELGLESAPYDWMGGFTDDFAYATATSYAARLAPGVKHIEYCGADYDRVTKAYMLNVARRAPADFIVRAYASVLQMVQLPLRWRMPPMLHSAVGFYRMRATVATFAQDAGVFLVLGAIFLVTAANLRLGLFLVVFVLYIGGYPAVQFGNRHFFHLEFITWWALGFLLQLLVTAVLARVRKQRPPSLPPGSMQRAAFVLGVCAIGLWAALWGARVYQKASLRPLVNQYLDAQRDPIVLETGPERLLRVVPASTVRTDPEKAELLEVDINERSCPVNAKINFVYDHARLGFSRPVTIVGSASHGPTRIFIPVYAQFRGIDVGDAGPGCLERVFRIRRPETFALMPELILRSDGIDRPLYQRMTGWGHPAAAGLMGSTKTILHVVGARPNYMKIAPIMDALRDVGGLRQVLVNTGQHYDQAMAKGFIRELSLPKPDRDLDVGSASHAVQTGNVMIRFEQACLEERPDLIVVVGDVNSTMAATLVAAKLLIPVAHVEAGLRSFNRTMPEEVNRIVTDRLADILLTPSPDADQNLRAEGIPDARIKLVGNVMIDTLLRYLPLATAERARQVAGLNGDRYAVVTLHRPSNVDRPETFAGILEAIGTIARGMPVVFSVHPRTQSRLREFNLLPATSAIIMTAPMGYIDFLSLTANAAVVLTDSGGIQEETTALGIRCLTLRANTERPITVTQGTNRVVGTEASDILEAFDDSMSHPVPAQRPDLWDGQASTRIAAILKHALS